jgi:hypothetical protein
VKILQDVFAIQGTLDQIVRQNYTAGMNPVKMEAHVKKEMMKQFVYVLTITPGTNAKES